MTIKFFNDPERLWKLFTLMLDGAGVTLSIFFLTLVFSVPLGMLVAQGRMSRRRLVRAPLSFYIYIMRSTPLMLQIMFIYFLLPQVLPFRVDRFWAVIFAFVINYAAYFAEIFRSGIMSIDKGQMEAGRSLGLNYLKTMWFVIAPQVLKNVLPTLANEFITLLKETSVAGYVAVSDLTFAGNRIRGVTYSPFMPLIAVAIIYLILVMFLTRMVGKLERRLRQGDNR